LSILDREYLKKILYMKLYFEGPSDWSIREYIEVIDDYLLERLPVIANSVLEPHGLEAYMLSEDEACRVLGENECKDKVVIAIQDPGTERTLFYAVYIHKTGSNTFEFQLKDVVSA